MDFETRRALRKQVDSAVRKRLKIKTSTRASTKPVAQSPGKTWTDDAIHEALRKIAEIAEVPVTELRLADYCRIRDANPSLGPERQCLRRRGIKLVTR